MTDRINLPQLREQIGHYDCDDEQPGVRTVEIKVVSVLALIDVAEAAQRIGDESKFLTPRTWERLQKTLTRFDFGDTT